MAKKEKDANCVPTGKGCCRVEAVIGVDERGQMVLPKEMRERANIRAGDKLAVTSWEKDGKVCCISLIKVEDLADMVKDMLGPVMGEILQK
jgi:antitoxin PrlF